MTFSDPAFLVIGIAAVTAPLETCHGALRVDSYLRFRRRSSFLASTCPRKKNSRRTFAPFLGNWGRPPPGRHLGPAGTKTRWQAQTQKKRIAGL